MITAIKIFFVILLFITIAILIYFWADWKNHITRVKQRRNKYNWGTYNKFVEQYEANHLMDQLSSNSSNCSDDDEIMNGDIYFNGRGMLLHYFAHLRVFLYMCGLERRRNKKKEMDKMDFEW